MHNNYHLETDELQNMIHDLHSVMFETEVGNHHQHDAQAADNLRKILESIPPNISGDDEFLECEFNTQIDLGDASQPSTESSAKDVDTMSSQQDEPSSQRSSWSTHRFSQLDLKRKFSFFKKPVDESEPVEDISASRRKSDGKSVQKDNTLKMAMSNVYQMYKEYRKRWNLSDLTLGLSYLAQNRKKQNKERPAEEISEEIELFLMEEVIKWKYYAKICKHTFKKDFDTKILKKRIIRKELIEKYEVVATAMRPAYLIYVDNNTQSVVLAIRGTNSLHDVLTDGVATVTLYMDGYGHKGMVQAAKWFEINVTPILRKLQAKYPTHGMHIIGHSMGGGVGALLGLMLRDEFPHLRCYCFAPAQVMSVELSRRCAEFITSFVYEDDFVTRFSVESVEDIRLEVSAFPWQEMLKRDIQSTRIVKFVSSIHQKVKNSDTYRKMREWKKKAAIAIKPTHPQQLPQPPQNNIAPVQATVVVPVSDSKAAKSQFYENLRKKGNIVKKYFSTFIKPTSTSASEGQSTDILPIAQIGEGVVMEFKSEEDQRFFEAILEGDNPIWDIAIQDHDNYNYNNQEFNLPQEVYNFESSDSESDTELPPPTLHDVAPKPQDKESPRFSLPTLGGMQIPPPYNFQGIRLYPPGMIYHIKKTPKSEDKVCAQQSWFFKRADCTEFEKIIISDTMFSDHKIEGYYNAVKELEFRVKELLNDDKVEPQESLAEHVIEKIEHFFSDILHIHHHHNHHPHKKSTSGDAGDTVDGQYMETAGDNVVQLQLQQQQQYHVGGSGSGSGSGSGGITEHQHPGSPNEPSHI